MKKKLLYYTLLVVIFIILLAIDVSILVLCNLVENRFLVAFGAIVTLSLFAFFKKIIKEWVDKIDLYGRGKENESDDTNKTPLMARFLNWNVRHYISLNTVILIVQIVFLYILPVRDTIVGMFTNDDLYGGLWIISRFSFMFIFLITLLLIIINWGYKAFQISKRQLALVNLGLFLAIDLTYVILYSYCDSDYWGYAFVPIICSILPIYASYHSINEDKDIDVEVEENNRLVVYLFAFIIVMVIVSLLVLCSISPSYRYAIPQ